MRKTNFILILIIIISSQTINAQEKITFQKIANNSLYVEALGSGIIGTLNYERKLIRFKNSNISARIGTGYFPSSFTILSLPAEGIFTLGANKHHLELGTGHTYIKIDETINGIEYKHTASLLTFRIGYKYEKPEGRFLFKVSLNPINLLKFESDDPLSQITFEMQPQSEISGGFCFGWSF